MSDPVRMVLVGATGLIGGKVIARAARRPDRQIVAIARRAMPLPPASQVDLRVAPTAEWTRLIAESGAEVIGIALGTTWRAAGRDEAAFRAVDQALVLSAARSARDAGIARCIAVSSVGASASARNFYLRVKGEVEQALGQMGFDRLDILRPGLLRGERGGERRLGERLGIIASPVTDALLQGGLRRYRSISAATVADAILSLAGSRAPGRQVLEHDGIGAAARRANGDGPPPHD